MRKILICNLTPRSGMLHYSSQFTNELSNRGDVNIKLAIASYYKGELYKPDIKKIKIRTNPNLLSFIFDSMNIFYHIYFLLKILFFRPNIVHFLDNHPWYIIYVYFFKLIGSDIYVTQHDPFPHSGEQSSLLSRVAIHTNKILRKKTDILIVHGDSMKQSVHNEYNIPQDKIISIPHGAYTFFNAYSKNLQVQKDTFLFFGRIVDYKGLDILLKSLDVVISAYPKSKLIIAGPGDLSPYKKYLDKYRDNIELYNYDITEQNMYKYFELSEFVILPYHDATGSGVIPVAYCFKKSVIVTNVGELPSVVLPGITGSVIPAESIDRLSKEIIYFLENKKKVIDMGIQGYQYSLDHLSWKPIVDKIYNSER